MATSPRYTIRDTLRAVDASKEIVLDVMFLTADLMHAIRNNLPIDLSKAQVTLQGARIEAPPTVIAEVMPLGRRRRASVVLGLIVAFVLAGLVGAFVTFQEYQGKTAAEAVAWARSGVTSALAFDANDPQLRLEAARHLAASGEASRSAALVEPLLDGRYRDEAIALAAPAWLAQGRLEDVRALVPKVGVNTKRPALLVDAFQQSWELDPRMTVTPRRVALSQLQEVAPGQFVGESEQGRVSFQTATPEDPDSWQDAIAAHRLCLVMECAFDVAPAELVEVVVNGEPRIGALIRETPSGAPFPIEHVRGWRHLLRGELDAVSAAQSLRAWRRLPQFDDVVAQSKDLRAPELAAQIASLLVFDFLANNHGRFASAKSEWGQNVGILDGRLIAKTRGEVFETRASRRVRGRLKWSERLPARQLANVLSMDVMRLGKRFFPVETPKRTDKLYAMSRQQQALGERSEELESQLGFQTAFPF
ncbi:MAG: hypothetical protein R3E66_02470 [bacterium]